MVVQKIKHNYRRLRFWHKLYTKCTEETEHNTHDDSELK